MNAMRPLLNEVDAALFDLDGTLVETNINFPLMKRKMLELAAENGVDTSGLALLDVLAVVEGTVNWLASDGRDDEVDALRERAMVVLEEIEIEHARGGTVIPYASDMIEQLKSRNVKVGIVTRNCRKASEHSIMIAGIEPDVLICREDAIHHKPHPDPVLIALESLDARPQASVMVGDHIMDIASGKAAGVKTIGFLRDDRPPDFFSKIAPDFVARSLREVLGAIINYNR
ncbi:MAG: HAD-IA family hydrolase [Armatimonadota bacterium]|nr:HAD-IA family hydrolase [bacterium]